MLTQNLQVQMVNTHFTNDFSSKLQKQKILPITSLQDKKYIDTNKANI